MKYQIIFLLLGCLVNSYCSAQVLEPSSVKETNISIRRPPKQTMIAVTFIADDTCNMTIDYKDEGTFINKATVLLPLGNHRVFFENLETGKTVRDRSFQLTRDKVTGGKYTYMVTFK